MLILIWALLVTNAFCHKVIESTEDIDPQSLKNTTTLYPVNNSTSTPEKASDVTSWKIETAYAESNLTEKDNNSTDSKEELVVERPGNASGEFRPSPQVSSYIEEAFVDQLPTRETYDSFASVIKQSPTGFVSYPKDEFKSFNKFPKEIFKNYHQFPYKIESAIITKAKTPKDQDWRPASMETRPTAEFPARLPAGGLYKQPDAFKEKPSLSGDDEDFGLEFNDGKEKAVKKHSANPWKKLLHILTALIPVGIIFSALTPNVITIQDTGAGNQLPAHILRRTDALAQLPAISERCRRRLLCELHSDRNYAQSPPSGRRGKQCHRIRCEDPEALARSLRWLLLHQPGAGDQRAHHNT